MTAAPSSGERVVLHVYEPAKARGPSIPGFGVYHTGIELCNSGVEWSYAGGPGAPGSGVQQQRAKQSPDDSVWRYKESVQLGATSKTAAQCSQTVRDMQAEYKACEYDLIHHNCNHFTSDVAKRLGVKYPSHINRAASFGAFFLDNPVKDRQRKDAERVAEEERKRNVFANSTGHSLLPARGASTAAAASPLHSQSPASSSAGASSSSASHSASSDSGSASGGSTRRPNPWANPTFFPGKGGKSATAAASRSANPKK